MRPARSFSPVVLLLFALALLPSRLPAQSFWLEPHSDRELYLEVLKPAFDGEGFSFATTSWFLAGRFTLSERLLLVAELPFSFASFSSGFDLIDESDATIGNPYVGLEIRSSESQLFGELGVRLPLAAQDNLATFTGLLADFVDRPEAFLPDVVSLEGVFNYGLRQPSGLAARFRVGPIVWFDVGEGAADTEVNFVYSSQLWYEADPLVAGGGFSGRWIVTADGGIGETTVHQLVLFVDVRFARWRPGFQVRIPLDDDLTRVIDLGLNLNVAFAVP